MVILALNAYCGGSGGQDIDGMMVVHVGRGAGSCGRAGDRPAHPPSMVVLVWVVVVMVYPVLALIVL